MQQKRIKHLVFNIMSTVCRYMTKNSFIKQTDEYFTYTLPHVKTGHRLVWTNMYIHSETLRFQPNKQTAELTTPEVRLLMPFPSASGILRQEILNICADVAAHFGRNDSAQVLDVFWSINQQPAINWGVCKPPQRLNPHKKKEETGSERVSNQKGRDFKANSKKIYYYYIIIRWKQKYKKRGQDLKDTMEKLPKD